MLFPFLEGVLKQTSQQNLHILINHVRSGQHVLITEQLRKHEEDEVRVDHEYAFDINTYYDYQYQITMRMIRYTI